jgi:hypothetical protein
MNELCSICAIDPSSHSFHKVSELEFYTCVGDTTKYDDTEGILLHYRNFLENHGENQWIWIFDCKNLGLKHILELKTAHGIIKLLEEKYGKNLKKIVIINPTWHIHSLLAILWPFLSIHIQSLIEILE